MMVSSPASHRPDYSRSLNEVVRTVGRAGARARYSTPGKLPDALLTLVNQLDDQQKRMLGVVRLFVLSRCNNSVSKEYLEPTRPVAAVESGGRPMPWTANDAEKHTHKATTTELKELWARIANERLEKTGDEGRAIREANSVIARQEGAR